MNTFLIGYSFGGWGVGGVLEITMNLQHYQCNLADYLTRPRQLIDEGCDTARICGCLKS